MRFYFQALKVINVHRVSSATFTGALCFSSFLAEVEISTHPGAEIITLQKPGTLHCFVISEIEMMFTKYHHGRYYMKPWWLNLRDIVSSFAHLVASFNS